MTWNFLKVTYHALLFAYVATEFEGAYYSRKFHAAEKLYEKLVKHGNELGECITEDHGGRASLRFIVEMCGMKLKSGMGEISHEEYQNYLKQRLERLRNEINEVEKYKRRSK